ncbi:MAG: tetraacyldisaccharide 4'-kinase [Planctomycetes bacterium]|nr:tetraacyldisaccharide 4'-kinase [Planctomycetota bacterium]
MSGQAGAWSAPVRAVLGGVEWLYASAVALRNRRYDRGAPTVRLAVPVISVGNITAGGTGKTPVVIALVRRLERLGRSPAVVARGYAAAPDGANDEERLIRKHCPAVVYVADADRARAARAAHERHGADVVVLDDGFQHRRLARDLDIVVLDATCPFGFERLLPRGLLRESPRGLRRAHVIVVSRWDQASLQERQAIETRVARLAPQAAVLHARHQVIAVEGLDGRDVMPRLAGARAVAFAGIGNFPAFLTTIRSLGVTVVGERRWRDHYRYTARDIDALRRRGAFPPHDLLLTTEKDGVKIAALHDTDLASIAVVRVAVDFLGEEGTILDGLLEKSLGPRKRS